MFQPNLITIDGTTMAMLHAIRDAGGRPLVVGGAVRDALMGSTNSKDFDVEVFGITADTLKNTLSRFGKVDEVGESFAVIKVNVGGVDFDFNLPRRDSKTGRGNGGFEVEVDHTMTVEDAARRRDFTINSVSFDPFTGEIINPFGGVEDIHNRILRPTSGHFVEDPLRILRGFQFVARFGLTWTDEVEAFGQQLKGEFDALPRERVREEWVKWALKGTHPGLGLKFLRAVGWMDFFPEVAALVGVPQDPIWHSEGDVWEHTCHVCDAMAFQCDRDGISGETRLALMFGALCHDFGKASNTWLMPAGEKWFKLHHTGLSGVVARKLAKFAWKKWMGEWRWRSPGHDQSGETPAREFMWRLFCDDAQKRESGLVNRVVVLVKTHMRHIGLHVNARTVRRLAVAVPLNDMAQVVNADSNGRPFNAEKWCANPVMVAILDKAEELAVKDNQPVPLLQGRHLIQIGMKPGVAFGGILKAAFEAQLDGEFDSVDGGVEWLMETGLA